MANSSVQARITQQEKEEFENILNQMGISTSDAIRIFVKQTINDKAFPFLIKIKEHKPKKKTEKKEVKKVESKTTKKPAKKVAKKPEKNKKKGVLEWIKKN